MPRQQSIKPKSSNQSWVCAIFPGVTGMCGTSGNEVLEAELCFGPAVTQSTRQGQCTWGLTEQKWVSMKRATRKGGNCVKATPLFLPAHLLIFLQTLLIPLRSFWVMRCCGRSDGHVLPQWWDQGKSGLSDSRAHMPREAQWGRSGSFNKAY